MSVNHQIQLFLENRKLAGKIWTAGGTIEDHIRATDGAKGGTVSKRLREMSGEGKTYNEAWHILDKNEDKGYVEYKLKDDIFAPKAEVRGGGFVKI